MRLLAIFDVCASGVEIRLAGESHRLDLDLNFDQRVRGVMNMMYLSLADIVSQLVSL